MRWLTLYLRSRRVPLAAATAIGWTAVVWAGWSVFSRDRQVEVPLVIFTVVVLVAAVTLTLSGPDDELDRTAAVRWWTRRSVHLALVLLLVFGLLAATWGSDARFGPAGLVVRDVAGLLGLAAAGAAVVGAARAWFAPLGWTLAAVVVATIGVTSGAAEAATWQAQPPDNRWAAATAGVLAVAGMITYVVRGPARRAPAEAALF